MPHPLQAIGVLVPPSGPGTGNNARQAVIWDVRTHQQLLTLEVRQACFMRCVVWCGVMWCGVVYICGSACALDGVHAGVDVRALRCVRARLMHACVNQMLAWPPHFWLVLHNWQVLWAVTDLLWCGRK